MSLLGKTNACFFFCLFSCGHLGAQMLLDTNTYTLEWRAEVLNIEGKKKSLLSFYKATHAPQTHFLPLYSFALAHEHVTSVGLKDAEWEPLSAAENVLLPNELKEYIDPRFSVTNGWAGRDPHTTVSFIPLRRNEVSGAVEKLVRFRLNIIQQNAVFPQSSSATSRINGQARLGDVGSVLSQGDWYKLGFPNTGIFKIDYAYLKTMGINPDSIDPRRIQVWGNGGGMLPELVDAARPVDLTETPVFMSGGEDGKFDIQDYLLLYVQGPDTWRKSARGDFYEHQTHLYSSYSYCFFTVGSSLGKRIRTIASSALVSEASFSSYSFRYAYDKNVINMLASGRRWYGEEFDDRLDQTFTVPSTGITSGRKVYFLSSLMNKSTDEIENTSSFQASLNGNNVNTYNLQGSSNKYHPPIGFQRDFLDSISSDRMANSKSLLVNYKYARSVNGLGIGYLDYFWVNFEEKLSAKSNPMTFRHLSSKNFSSVSYVIEQGISNEPLFVWDVTDLFSIYQLETQTTGISTHFTTETKDMVREYVAFFGDKFPSPSTQTVVRNQNLASTSVPNLLIVTHPFFKVQAEKLAEFRRRNDNLEVVVATTEEVYNEFSSGAQDLVAIRDFSRMYHQRDIAANPKELKFKYLLLFGDASYDYKNVLGYSTPSSYVPIYESEESLRPLSSYSSDDYVGMLSPGEGVWGDFDRFPMDIGVGRIPAINQSEAESVVNKLIAYATSVKGLGAWRQNLSYVCDNMEDDGEDAFIENGESLVAGIEKTASAYNSKKIYVGAYPKETSPSGVTAPGANRDLNAYLNSEGSLIMTYIGHGGYNAWASESILTIPQIQALTNFNKLTFFVTATCNFGQYDHPGMVSGGELLLLQPQGGAIGLLTTARPVYQHTNATLNDAFHANVFLREAPSLQHLRMGDILQRTKNASLGTLINTRNFALLGDPSMILAYPKDNIAITQLNNHAYVTMSDTLKAKTKVTISGEIRSPSGTKKEDFNGVVNVIVYDKKTSSQTIDKIKNFPIIPFQVRETKIFDGTATVKNGDFDFTLVIPRNINYNVGLGKISLYAHSENGNMDDAGVGETGIYVGGADTNTQFDNTPPVVQLFMNDESFVSGGFTNDHPLFLIKLYDEQGISSVGSTGRSITATLNHENKSDLILDSYYKTDRDTYKSGTIRYPFSNLKEGPNTIKVKAFDTDTNSATATLDFVVGSTKDLALKNILNYPNPFTTTTSFHFDHNRPGDDLEVMIQVFTVSGRLVKTLTTYASGSQTHFSNLQWDGKDDYGDEIGRGVYVYRVSVQAQSDGSKIEEYQKLVVLN